MARMPIASAETATATATASLQGAAPGFTAGSRPADSSWQTAPSTPVGSVAKQRHAYLDSAKGLAILLVVIGHVIARETPKGAEWYDLLKLKVYVFHMPFFMFLSGLAYGFSLRVPTSVQDYVSDLRRRSSRLLMAYLALGILIFAGKLLFQQFTTVDNPVKSPYAFFEFLIDPRKSFAAFLWYVYVLIVLYAVMPLLYAALKTRLWILLPICIAFQLLPTEGLFNWIKFRDFAMFFVAGVLAAQHHKRFAEIIDKTWIVAFIAFAAALPLAESFLFEKPDFTSWLTSVLAIIALTGLSRQPWFDRAGFFRFIGAFTLSIYLFNTIVMGVGKIVLSKLIGWDGPIFMLVFAILLVSGVYVPILMKRHLFSRVPALDRIT